VQQHGFIDVLKTHALRATFAETRSNVTRYSKTASFKQSKIPNDNDDSFKKYFEVKFATISNP
jgi:hypothetical protein